MIERSLNVSNRQISQVCVERIRSVFVSSVDT